MQSSGRLYLVATPIGNLSEISQRAIEVLKSADRIFCENTQSALRLLTHLGITGKPLKAVHEGNEKEAADEVIFEIAAGKNIAYISEAGCPGISDPGFRLVRASRHSGISIEAIGVSSAFLNALIISGLPTDQFMFCGFPPPKTVARQNFFKINCFGEHTVVFYESCHRLLKSIADLKQVVGENRCVSIAAELTKLHESVQTGPLGSLKLPASPKGEWVICVAKPGYEL